MDHEQGGAVKQVVPLLPPIRPARQRFADLVGAFAGGQLDGVGQPGPLITGDRLQGRAEGFGFGIGDQRRLDHGRQRVGQPADARGFAGRQPPGGPVPVPQQPQPMDQQP